LARYRLWPAEHAGPPASSPPGCRAFRRHPNNCCGVDPCAAPPRKPIPHRYSFPQQFSPFARWPRAPAASSSENLKQPHRLRLGLGQKLSVRHVSNPNRTSITLDNRRSLLGLEGGERRPLSIYRLACLVGWHNCWNASEGDFVCLECRRSGVHQK
jgi:hypothetical protein